MTSGYKKFIVSALSLCLAIYGCLEKDSFFECDQCSELRGLKLNRIDSVRDEFLFDLKYPVGLGSEIYFKPHFEIEMKIKFKDDIFFKIRGSKENIVPIWNLRKVENVYSFMFNNQKVQAKIDSVFFDDNSEKIYSLRLKNLWKENYDNPMGSDFVMFVSKSGLKGMYISKIGNEIFDESLPEIVYYPIGEIYHLRVDHSVKIIE